MEVFGGVCSAPPNLKVFLRLWKGWLHSNAMAYFHHEAVCDVTQLIVLDYGEANSWTAQGMLYTEWLATNTV